MPAPTIINAQTTTAHKFGGDALNYLGRYLNGVDVTSSIGTPIIRTPTKFPSSKLIFTDPQEDNTVTVKIPALSTDKTINLVPTNVINDDEPLYRTTVQTVEGKVISAGTNTITGLTNSNLSGSAGITAPNLAQISDKAKLHSSIAYEDEANIFTAQQQISFDSSTLLTQRRPIATAEAVLAGYYTELRDSAGSNTAYAKIETRIGTNTDGNETGFLDFYVMKNGVIGQYLILDGSQLSLGLPGVRAILDSTGISASSKTFTFPNVTGELVIGTDTRLSDDRTPTAHNHAAGDINSGTMAIAQLPVATEAAKGIAELATSAETTAGLVVQASDTRLSDSRAPTTHNHDADYSPLGHLHAYDDITDKPTEFAPSAHNHAAGDINSGTLAVAQGGLNKSTITEHALLKGGAANTYSEITPSVTDGQVLKMVTGTPAWADESGGTLTDVNNVGTGVGQVFRDVATGEINLKTIKAGANVTITNNADDVTIESTGGGGGGGTGIGGTIALDGDVSTNKTVFEIPHGLTELPEGYSVQPSSIDALGDYQVDIDATNIIVTYQSAPPTGTGNVVLVWMAGLGEGGSGTLTDVANVGTGEGLVFRDIATDTVNLKTIKAGANVTITNNADDITIASSGEGGGGTGTVVGGVSLQSGDAIETVFVIAHGLEEIPDSVSVDPSSADALGDYIVDFDETNITITYAVPPSDATNNLQWNWIAATATSGGGGSGEANTNSNVGDGAGELVKTKVALDTPIKTIKAGTNITVTNNADDVTIASTGGGGGGTALAGLTDDVDVDTPTDGQILEYSDVDDKWHNVANVVGDADISGAENVGTGIGVFKQEDTGVLEFKTLTNGSVVTAAANGDTNHIDLGIADTSITNTMLAGSIATAKLADSSNFILKNQANEFDDNFSQTFRDDHLRLGNAAHTNFTWFRSTATTSRAITFPDATTTLVGDTNTQTISNKTLTAPTINGIRGSVVFATEQVILTAADTIVFADATTAQFSVVFPPAASSAGVVYMIVKTDSSSNAVLLNPSGSEVVNNAVTRSITVQYRGVTVACDGTQWFIISDTHNAPYTS